MHNEIKFNKQLLLDPKWRLSHLYKIIDAQGKQVTFDPNPSQLKFLNDMHYFNIILKARQLGFSTLSMIYLLDACLFVQNHSAGVIAQGLTEAEDLFKNKIKYAYDHLPSWLRDKVTATTDTSRKMVFSNGSSISVGTSLRGGTFQKLHVSEYGKISARYPEKAREIKTGALNTIHAGQQIIIESTAEGQQGEFYELCRWATRIKQEGKELTSMQPKLHFFPWHANKDYVLHADVVVTVQYQEYFAKLDAMGIKTTPAQRAWYVNKSELMGDDMKREFPSTPKEAFEQSMEGAVYARQMKLVRESGQIGKFPHEPSQRVYTYWDLGKGSDDTVILFFQHIGNEYRFIDFHESSNEGWEYYAKLLSSKPYTYAEHVLPHDAETKVAGKKMSTIRNDLNDLGVRPIRVVKKTSDLWADIKGKGRSTLPRCSFDEVNCAQLIKHLDNYRREWDEKLGVFKDRPRHDDASHGADGYRTFFMGFDGRKQEVYNYEIDDKDHYVGAEIDWLDV